MGKNSKEVQARADAKRAAYTGRNWTFLFYPENAPEDWLQQLTDLKIRMFISPLHDRDRFTKKDEEQGYERADEPDNEEPPADGAKSVSHLKKAHRHVLLQSSNAHFSFNKLKGICDGINADAIKAGGRPWVVYPPLSIAKVADFRAYARYLCHLDTRDKAIYDPNDVIALWGLDYTQYAVNDETLDMVFRKALDGLHNHPEITTPDDAVRYVLRAFPYEGNKLVKVYGRYISDAGRGNFLRSLANQQRYKVLEGVVFIDSEGFIRYGDIVGDMAFGRWYNLDEFYDMRRSQYVPVYVPDVESSQTEKPAGSPAGERPKSEADYRVRRISGRLEMKLRQAGWYIGASGWRVDYDDNIVPPEDFVAVEDETPFDACELDELDEFDVPASVRVVEPKPLTEEEKERNKELADAYGVFTRRAGIVPRRKDEKTEGDADEVDDLAVDFEDGEKRGGLFDGTE